MTKLRAFNGFYINAYDITTNTGKTVYFDQLEYRFPSILLIQTTDDKNDLCTHHIVIHYESRVRFLQI